MEEVAQNQSSTAQPVSTPPIPAKQNNKLLVVIAVFVFLLMAGSLVYLGYQNYQLRLKLNQLLEQQLIPDTGVEPTSLPTTANKMSLSEALSQFCVNNKIDLDKLPFTFNQTIKNSYKIQNLLNCFVPEESYASMSISIKTPDFTGDVRNVYFFHQNSKFMGMGDFFQPLNNYKPVNINSQNYWLNVREPGPYGISSLGVWIDLIGEKKDASTGTTVRVMNIDILKDQQYIDLVKNYGAQASSADGGTIYVISDSAKKAQFIDEVVKLAPQNSALKVSAQNITTDLSGISF